IVADHDGGRAQAALLAFVLELHLELPVRPREGHQGRPERHIAAAPIALLVGFAVFQQLRIQAEAGIDQEHLPVEQPDLHRLRLGGQQAAGGDLGILGDAVGAPEIVERALRQDAERQAGSQHCLGHRAERAVSAGSDHHPAVVAGTSDGRLRRRGQLAAAVDRHQLVAAAGPVQHSPDDGLDFVGVITAGARVQHAEEWLLACQGGARHGAKIARGGSGVQGRRASGGQAGRHPVRRGMRQRPRRTCPGQFGQSPAPVSEYAFGLAFARPTVPPRDDSFSLRKIAVPAFGPTILYGVSNGAILPVIALSARGLDASVAVSGLIVALIGIGSLVSNIPAALITSRHGERRSMMGAAALSAVALLLCIFATHALMLAVGVFLVGMASSVFMLARQTYMIDAVPTYMRARALSTLAGTMRIGVFVGPFAGAGLIHFMGLQGAYWVAVVAMAGAGVIAYLAPDMSAPGRGGDTAAAKPRVLDVARQHSRVFLTLGLGILLVSAVRASRQVVIPLWADHLGINPATTSIIYGLVAAI